MQPQTIKRWILGLCLSGFCLATSTAGADEKIGNFMLIDQHGKAMELYYHTDADVVVLMAHRRRSPLVAQSARELLDIQKRFSGVRVFLINAVNGEDRHAIRADMDSAGLGLRVLDDRAQLVTESLQLTHAGQALVLDTKSWRVLYRGPVIAQAGDRSGPLARAVADHLAGDPVRFASRAMPAEYDGEALALSGAAARNERQQISYSASVAPILMQKCVDCHRPGGIGPWAMTSHAMVQGFSPMIRETILSKRMPPWHADPAVGSFAHDISLSVEEQRTLVHWIDAGSRRGDGPDPLLEVTPRTSAWELGEPDLVIELPDFTVPATGVLDYENFSVTNPLDESVWVRAVQIIPGNRQAVHHVIATVSGNPVAADGADSNALIDPQLMTFVPGNEVYQYPQSTGLRVPAGGSFHAQMHYTTFGREATDQTRIGLYFADRPPQHELQHFAIINPQLQIPAGAAAHEESAYYQLQHDAVIYALFPHAHYRGKSSSFSFRYPDGTEELVLNSPHYDFNWQRYFRFSEPRSVPAGTLVIHRTVYDNSANNLSNPAPEIAVSWGEQTTEEMLYGGISYRYVDSAAASTEADREAHVMTSLALGFLDTNMDGRVALDEMPGTMQDQLLPVFIELDSNQSGGLEYDQMLVLMTQTPLGDMLTESL